MGRFDLQEQPPVRVDPGPLLDAHRESGQHFLGDAQVIRRGDTAHLRGVEGEGTDLDVHRVEPSVRIGLLGRVAVSRFVEGLRGLLLAPDMLVRVGHHDLVVRLLLLLLLLPDVHLDLAGQAEGLGADVQIRVFLAPFGGCRPAEVDEASVVGRVDPLRVHVPTTGSALLQARRGVEDLVLEVDQTQARDDEEEVTERRTDGGDDGRFPEAFEDGIVEHESDLLKGFSPRSLAWWGEASGGLKGGQPGGGRIPRPPFQVCPHSSSPEPPELLELLELLFFSAFLNMVSTAMAAPRMMVFIFGSLAQVGSICTP